MSEKDLWCYMHCCDKKNQQMQIKGVNYVEKGILYSLLWFVHMAHMERENRQACNGLGANKECRALRKVRMERLQRITIGISS